MGAQAKENGVGPRPTSPCSLLSTSAAVSIPGISAITSLFTSGSRGADDRSGGACPFRQVAGDGLTPSAVADRIVGLLDNASKGHEKGVVVYGERTHPPRGERRTNRHHNMLWRQACASAGPVSSRAWDADAPGSAPEGRRAASNRDQKCAE